MTLKSMPRRIPKKKAEEPVLCLVHSKSRFGFDSYAIQLPVISNRFQVYFYFVFLCVRPFGITDTTVPPNK